MELDLPDWPSVHVGESVCDRRAHEVPKFDAAITATCDEMGACWMEVNGRDPIAMALTGHDVFTSVHVPDFPGAIVGSSSNNLLSLMKSHTSYTFVVRRNLSGSCKS